MTRHLIVRPIAEADVDEARRWYEKREQGLGDQLLVEIGHVMKSIRQNPEQNPPYYRDVRRQITNRFPYKVFYRIEGDTIVVLRILHAKQDHPRWLQ